MRTFYMLRNTFLAVLTVLAVASAAQAAITLNATSSPLAQGGLVQWQISAVGDAGESLNTFSKLAITPDGTGAGIHNVSQAFTNAATPTIGQHTPGLWNDAWTPYDTYFKFAGAADLALDLGTPFGETNNNSTTGMLGLPTTPGPPMSGYGNYTSGADSTKVLVPAKAGANINFLQVVLKEGEAALLDVEVVGNGGAAVQNFADFRIGGGVVVLPPVISLVNLGEIESTGVIMANLMASEGPNTWSALTPTAGTPALAATLGADGAFSWDPAGSARGPKGNGRVYSWTATATNAGGADTDVAISLSLIPEPATVSLLGLAIVGLVGLIRKR
jgi:hypothetical protein